jgi:lipopolysaccharide export system permease protein
LILKRYINNEVLRVTFAVLLVLILIFLSTRFIKFIQLAVEGTISSGAVFQLLGLQIPAVVGFLLPLSFFLAIMLVFGRLYSESEMAAIKSFGLSDFRLATHILSIAILLALTSAALSFWVTPWSTYQTKVIMLKEESESRYGALSPGQFQENADNSGVFFVNSKNEAGKIFDIFAVSGVKKNQQELKVTVAKSGYMVNQSKSRKNNSSNNSKLKKQDYMVLEKGAIYAYDKKTKTWEISEYDSHFTLLKPPKEEDIQVKTRAIDTLTLWENYDAVAVAELHWRLSAPLSILLLGFLAVPLSRTEPRKGKF